MAIYPSNYPCPTWQYGQTLSTYQSRTPFDCGWTRQRKQWPQTGSSVDLTFVMATTEYTDWQAWMDANGYDWFTIDLDMFSGVKKPTDIRLVTGVQYVYDDYDNISVTVSGEIQNA